MARMRTRRRRDGTVELVRRGRCRSAASGAAVVLLAVASLLALVAVVPVVALALPPLAILAAFYPLWRRLAASPPSTRSS